MTAMPLSGAQKCAVLLLLLDEPQAAELLRQLAADEVHAVGHAMLSVAEIEPRAIDSVLDDFLLASRATAALGQGGSQVRSVLERALGSARAGGVIQQLGPPVSARAFAMLDWDEPHTLATLLADEHPQATAVVLAHLAPAVASAVLAALPQAQQADLLYRLARIGTVSSADIADLEAGLDARLGENAPSRPAPPLAGPDVVAKLLNLSSDQARLLTDLAALDPDLATMIAENLFVFADILRLDARAMQALVREVDPAVIVVALKGASAALRDHIFSAMSARAATQLQDDLAQLGPLKLAEVQAAQGELARAVRRLADDGVIMLPGRAGGYV